jgi:tRNA modification GTPase
MREDTIAAIATPPGEGGIGIVRISGAEASAIGAKLFDRPLRDRRAVFGHVRDPESGEIVDEALGLFMRAPRTYTCEDVVELQSHGGPICLERILELTLREGARQAEPGEFTLRAFLNGRIDLAQAEAVLDVIRSKTEAARRLAVQGLGGRLSGEIRSIRRALVDQLAYLSARADFPDEDVPPADIRPALEAAERALDGLLQTARTGMLYRQGAEVALVGSPNVGKSSLMNRLLREDRAIVTPYAGTTRDTVTESMNVGGVPVVLTDTAGLESTESPIERLGIERSRAAIERSDLLLIVLECGRAMSEDERLLLEATQDRARLIVLNKIDIGDEPPIDFCGLVRVSALTGEGLRRLEERLRAELLSGDVSSADQTTVTNPRHHTALLAGRRYLRQARDALQAGLPEDITSTDLRLAVSALGEITGESITEDLLDSIFRNFCIGK